MNSERVVHFNGIIPSDALVVDIGGGANPYPRADYVIDGLDFDARGALRKGGAVEERVTKERWVKLDLCDRTPWPFPDKYFDYATCTHVLEDVRDPIWVCSEIMRIAKAGYIETPSRMVEQARGVEHPCYAGYYHHRWLVSAEGNALFFRLKPHLLHVSPSAIVADVGCSRMINPKYADLCFEWSDSFTVREVMCFDEQAMHDELCDVAADSRLIPDLLVKVDRSWLMRLKRWLYFRRLKRQATQKSLVSRKRV
jgi:hypothetical protein